MKLPHLQAIFASFLATFISLQAAEFYVSSGGDDAAAGTAEAPFRTLQRAAEAMQPGDVCLVAPGTYRETVTPPTSGTADAPIVFRAAPGERAPVVSGLEVLSGDWAIHEGAIYKLENVPHDLGRGYNQIFVDGEPLTLARFPKNRNLMRAETVKAPLLGVAPDGESAAVFDPEHLARDLNGATLSFNLHCGVSTSMQVVGGDGKGHLDLAPDMWLPYYAAGREVPYYIDDHLSLLTEPGEYFFDRATRTLYLRLPEDADPREHRIEMKARALGWDLTARSHIDTEGIDLFATTLTTHAPFDMADEASQTSLASHIRIRGIRALYPSWFTRCERNIPGQDIWLPSVFLGGLKLIGDHLELHDSEVAHSSGSLVVCLGTHNKIINNHLHHQNYNGWGAHGAITFGRALPPGPTKDYSRRELPFTGYGNEAAYNTIHDCGRSAIEINGNRAGRIHHNEAFNCMQNSGDGGIFYGWREDMLGLEMDHNYIHSNNLESWINIGIYLDGLYNVQIHHNIIVDVEIGMSLNMYWGGQRWVYNNTILSKKYAIDYAYWGIKEEWHDTYIVNNIFGSPTLEELERATEYSHNLMTGTDPGFIDWEGRNFALRTGARAIDQGKVAPPYTDGFAGAAPDLGAIEFGAEAWEVGSTLVGRKTMGGLPPEAPVLRDAAFEASVLASSQDVSGHEPWKMLNGIHTTNSDRWVAGAMLPQSVTIDLGADTTIHSIRLRPHDDTPFSFEVIGRPSGKSGYSDWLVVKADHASSAPFERRLAAPLARYVTLTITDGPAGRPISLRAFEVLTEDPKEVPTYPPATIIGGADAALLVEWTLLNANPAPTQLAEGILAQPLLGGYGAITNARSDGWAINGLSVGRRAEPTVNNGKFQSIRLASVAGKPLRLGRLEFEAISGNTAGTMVSVFAYPDGGEPVLVLDGWTLETDKFWKMHADLSALPEAQDVEFRIVFHGQDTGRGHATIRNVQVYAVSR